MLGVARLRLNSQRVTVYRKHKEYKVAETLMRGRQFRSLSGPCSFLTSKFKIAMCKVTTCIRLMKMIRRIILTPPHLESKFESATFSPLFVFFKKMRKVS